MILSIDHLAGELADLLISKSLNIPAQSIALRDTLDAHLAAKYGQEAPASLALPSTLDRLTWGVAQYLEAPTTAQMDALRILLKAELERFSLAERWTVGDQIREFSARCTASQRCALDHFVDNHLQSVATA